MTETPVVDALPASEPRPPKVRTRPAPSMFQPAIVRRAVVDALVKLDPRQQIKNPVMFVVLVCSVLTTVLLFGGLPWAAASQSAFVGLVAVWLWFTVLFANFAEAVAAGRGKANSHSAILSAVIFNALIIVLLIPLAPRGVKFQAMGAAAALRATC